jgi:hypothetical protein
VAKDKFFPLKMIGQGSYAKVFKYKDEFYNKFFSDAGAIANFCTVLLFVIFVIGKLWILFRNSIPPA